MFHLEEKVTTLREALEVVECFFKNKEIPCKVNLPAAVQLAESKES